MNCVVIGSGPCALAVALRLRQEGLEVLIIKDDDSNFSETFGETITPEIINILDSLGLYISFLDSRMQPITEKKSNWNSSPISSSVSMFHSIGFGWRLDKSKLLEIFLEALRQLSIHELIGRVQKINIRENFFEVHCEVHGKIEMLNCQYLVIATGREKPRFLELPSVKFVDKLIAVNARFCCESNLPNGECEILTDIHKNGWFYSINLQDNERLISYYTDADLLETKSKESFCKFLVKELPDLQIIGGILNTLDFSDFKYNVLNARSYYRSSPRIKNMFIAGDLAQTFDPISSSGVLKALEDGIRTAEQILYAVNGEFLNCDYHKANFIRIRSYSNYLRERFNLYSTTKEFSKNDFWRRRQDFASFGKFIK